MIVTNSLRGLGFSLSECQQICMEARADGNMTNDQYWDCMFKCKEMVYMTEEERQRVGGTVSDAEHPLIFQNVLQPSQSFIKTRQKEKPTFHLPNFKKTAKSFLPSTAAITTEEPITVPLEEDTSMERPPNIYLEQEEEQWGYEEPVKKEIWDTIKENKTTILIGAGVLVAGFFVFRK